MGGGGGGEKWGQMFSLEGSSGIYTDMWDRGGKMGGRIRSGGDGGKCMGGSGVGGSG